VAPPARPTNAARLLLLSGVALLGCPQLLDDDWSLASLPVQTGGTGPCSTTGCVLTDGDAAAGGAAGTTAGSGGAAGGGAAGTSGASGSSGGVAGNGAAGASSGDGGAAADGDAGTTPDADGTPPDPSEPDATPVGPSCRIVTLNDSTQSASDNCVGIYGWNAVTNGSGSTLSRTFSNGDVCFSGSISNAGYGAVYNLTLSNELDWNANTYGATGFEFAFSGSVPSGTLNVLYTVDDDGDYCHPITATGTVSVPFSEAPPCASYGGGSSSPDVTRLTILQLNFGPGNYAVNFCVEIRALP